MIYKTLLGSFLALSIAGLTHAETIVIDEKVVFAKGAEIRQAVKDECQLEQKFSRFLDEYMSGQGIAVVTANSSKAKGVDKRLHIEIDRVEGGGGGAWSGGKMVHAVGSLTEKGKVIGSFKVQRTSGGGAFGAFKGTCSILGRDVKAMAKDVSRWITSPSKDARLGEL